MENAHDSRRRAKVSGTVDPARVRQNEAMVEQFSAAEPPEESELRGWRQIRRAAVRKSYER